MKKINLSKMMYYKVRSLSRLNLRLAKLRYYMEAFSEKDPVSAYCNEKAYKQTLKFNKIA